MDNVIKVTKFGAGGRNGEETGGSTVMTVPGRDKYLMIMAQVECVDKVGLKW